MKKVISVLLSLIMLFSLTAVAFAAGNWQEEEAYQSIRNYCPYHGEGECKGYFYYDEDLKRQVGCDCCEKCPNYIKNGVAVNIGEYSGCFVDSYFDIDTMNADGSLAHKGDLTTHYYWKAKCCGLCTGKSGCKCNNTEDLDACGCPYCKYKPDHTDEKIEEGLEKGRQGYIKGIQTALKSMRDVMYELFDALFKFLRLDDVIGKWPGRQG